MDREDNLMMLGLIDIKMKEETVGIIGETKSIDKMNREMVMKMIMFTISIIELLIYSDK